jgi:hypothetical protein
MASKREVPHYHSVHTLPSNHPYALPKWHLPLAASSWRLRKERNELVNILSSFPTRKEEAPGAIREVLQALMGIDETLHEFSDIAPNEQLDALKMLAAFAIGDFRALKQKARDGRLTEKAIRLALFGPRGSPKESYCMQLAKRVADIVDKTEQECTRKLKDLDEFMATEDAYVSDDEAPAAASSSSSKKDAPGTSGGRGGWSWFSSSSADEKKATAASRVKRATLDVRRTLEELNVDADSLRGK